MVKSPKILFICKQRLGHYGQAYGLVNSAKSTSIHLKSIGIESKVVTVIDNNGIDREVHEYSPTHVIILALWVVPKKIQVLVNKYPEIKWFVSIHSKTPFLAGEGIAFQWLCEYKKIHLSCKNFWVAANNTQIKKDIEKVYGMRVCFLPNMYTPPTIKPPLRICNKLRPKSEIHIGSFGAIRPLKNTLMQAIASIRFADQNNYKLVFHINGDRTEQHGDNIVKNIVNLFACMESHKLVMHPWASHGDFVNKIIPQMNLGLQTSLSESFNIVAADFTFAGVPIVGSNEIQWLPRIFKPVPTDTNAILKSMYMALILGKFGVWVNKMHLKWHNKKSLKKWMKLIYKG